jgi:hypothetical protein
MVHRTGGKSGYMELCQTCVFVGEGTEQIVMGTCRICVQKTTIGKKESHEKGEPQVRCQVPENLDTITRVDKGEFATPVLRHPGWENDSPNSHAGADGCRS